MRTAPTDWPLLGCDDCPDLDALPTVEGGITRDQVETLATSHLWNWTGRRYGLTPVTVRPQHRSCDGSTYLGRSGVATVGDGGWGWTPTLIDGEWHNLGCGSCGSMCGCDRLSTMRLPGPVASVSEVVIDGVPLDTDAYRVDNRKLLVRQDGGSWPWCNDLTRPDGDPGTWSVTYLRGTEVPVGGQIAAGTLACEFAKALCGSRDCRLPQRVQTVSREGVTVAVLDTFEGIESGQTGIWLVDSWVASVTRSPVRSRVYSPDLRGPRRVTS